MKKIFGVIGLGKFGLHVAMKLRQLNQEVIVFDIKEEPLELVKDYVTSAQILDSTHKEALVESGLTRCHTVIVSIGRSADASFLTVLNLKELSIPTIIVKANTPEQGRILEKIGATRVVYPEKESAVRLANQLTSSDILEFLEVSEDYQVAEVLAPESFFDRELRELNLREHYHVIPLAIRRKDAIIGVPLPQEKIQDGDILGIVGETNNVRAFIKAHQLDRVRKSKKGTFQSAFSFL
ncbi:TrkA family potassium uptake protein [Candidatus Woesearchaeota archaeon]|nr:TrkA family potassium uptake protein [Candidatus Woesearchaeota archaeon]